MVHSAKIVGISHLSRQVTDGEREFEMGGVAVTVAWTSDEGFGELTLRQDAEDGSMHLFTEQMGKDFAMEVLAALLKDAEIEE
jgi:hypothetical protein